MKTLYAIKSEIGDNVIHIGSKSECELIHKSFITYGIRSDKLYIECVQSEMNYGLTAEEIEKLHEIVLQSYKDGSYGSEQLHDMFENEIDGMTLGELIYQVEYGLVDESCQEIVKKYKTNKAIHEEVL